MMGNELILSRNDVAESEKIVVEWAEGLGINAVTELTEAGDGSTVLTAAADAHNSQTLYLWEDGNAPATTEYTQNNGNYSDDPDFRPYLVSFPVPEGMEVKGAVLICAGVLSSSAVMKTKGHRLPRSWRVGGIRVLL